MQTTPSPGLPRRLAALLYDTLLVLPLVMLVVALATAVQLGLSGQSAGKEFSDTLHPQLVQGLSLLTVSAFYSYFWRQKGQTLGMQAWRIRLRPIDDHELGWGRVLLRCGAAIVSALPAGAGYWWCLFDRNKRYWHDYLSGSELELLPKPDKQAAR